MLALVVCSTWILSQKSSLLPSSRSRLAASVASEQPSLMVTSPLQLSRIILCLYSTIALIIRHHSTVYQSVIEGYTHICARVLALSLNVSSAKAEVLLCLCCCVPCAQVCGDTRGHRGHWNSEQGSSLGNGIKLSVLDPDTWALIAVPLFVPPHISQSPSSPFAKQR